MRSTSIVRRAASVRRILASALLAISFAAYTPHASFAKADDDDPDAHYDGRVQGYENNVELKSSSTGMSWLLVIGLGIVCVSVIFKDAKRSHLD